jgi:hypothetical protein
MKKQVLTLTICLALTASSALANSTAKTTMKLTTQQANKAAEPKSEITGDCPCKASPTAECPLTKEQFKQKIEERMAKRREALYCKLGLTPEQKTKAVAMDTKNRTEAKALVDKIQEERIKLMDLKSKKACPVCIVEQKLKLRTAKKALHKHFATSEKSFEAILTKDQLTKFNAIREEHKARFKNHGKCKGNYPCHKHPLQ